MMKKNINQFYETGGLVLAVLFFVIILLGVHISIDYVSCHYHKVITGIEAAFAITCVAISIKEKSLYPILIFGGLAIMSIAVDATGLGDFALFQQISDWVVACKR